VAVTVCHYPPGTSKWNKIEHRMFSFISLNWRGQPLVSYETVVNLISHPATRTGLRVKARLDPQSYVTGRKVTQGQYVNAGEVLFTVTDLSSIWVKADVYQPDVPSVHSGQSVEITADSLPGTSLHGRVGFLDTSIAPQTRTASARIEVPNPSMRLRPGMFVQVKFAAPAGHDVLAIPRSAVLDTGMRKFVYVAKGNGEFEGRQVRLGASGTDYYPVLAGLKEGERIVSQGSFLIDSQTSNHWRHDRTLWRIERIRSWSGSNTGGFSDQDHLPFGPRNTAW
jgi:hypothetical protein